MEDTLGVLKNIATKVTACVLILVLMEDTLGERQEAHECLNPILKS